jgi:hypothetical protein
MAYLVPAGTQYPPRWRRWRKVEVTGDVDGFGQPEVRIDAAGVKALGRMCRGPKPTPGGGHVKSSKGLRGVRGRGEADSAEQPTQRVPEVES